MTATATHEEIAGSQDIQIAEEGQAMETNENQDISNAFNGAANDASATPPPIPPPPLPTTYTSPTINGILKEEVTAAAIPTVNATSSISTPTKRQPKISLRFQDPNWLLYR